MYLFFINSLTRRTMSRISETIPVLYVPGDSEVGVIPTMDSIR